MIGIGGRRHWNGGRARPSRLAGATMVVPRESHRVDAPERRPRRRRANFRMRIAPFPRLVNDTGAAAEVARQRDTFTLLLRRVAPIDDGRRSRWVASTDRSLLGWECAVKDGQLDMFKGLMEEMVVGTNGCRACSITSGSSRRMDDGCTSTRSTQYSEAHRQALQRVPGEVGRLSFMELSPWTA